MGRELYARCSRRLPPAPGLHDCAHAFRWREGARAGARRGALARIAFASCVITRSQVGEGQQWGASANPDLGRMLLEFFMSAEGQTIMADKLRIAALNPDVAGDNTASAMQLALGNQLRPVPVSPGLMVYLDQVKRARLIKRWNDALRLQ